MLCGIGGVLIGYYVVAALALEATRASAGYGGSSIIGSPNRSNELITRDRGEQAGGGGDYQVGARRSSETFTLKNSGWYAERIDQIRITTSGAVLARSAGTGLTIAPGKSGRIAVRQRTRVSG